MSFVTKGKAVTTTAAKLIYNDIELSQETFHEQYRYPHSKSPSLKSNRVAVCYYLLDEGRVLYLTSLYKYYTLIYKIRLHLRLDSDDVLSSLDTLPYDRSASFGCPFVIKRHAVTTTAAKSIYNDIKLFLGSRLAKSPSTDALTTPTRPLFSCCREPLLFAIIF